MYVEPQKPIDNIEVTDVPDCDFLIATLISKDLIKENIMLSPHRRALDEWSKRPWYKRIFGKKKFVRDYIENMPSKKIGFPVYKRD